MGLMTGLVFSGLMTTAGLMSWLDGSFTAKAEPMGFEVRRFCPTYVAEIEVSGEGIQSVCIFGENPNFRFGTVFLHGSIPRLVAAYRYDAAPLVIQGICEGSAGCVYDSGGDVLLARRLMAGNVLGVEIIKDFTQHLIRGRQEGRDVYRYEGDPGSALVDPQGTPLSIGAVSLSANGRWATFEVKDRGIVVMEMETGVMTRLTGQGYRYGIGIDPEYELGISDDGRMVAATGFNAGLSLYVRQGECGQPVEAGMSIGFGAGHEECPAAPIDPVALVPGFRFATRPRLTSGAFSFFAGAAAGQGRYVSLRLTDMPEAATYVALGDSFSSGEGEWDDAYYRPGTNIGRERCHLSNRSYPFLAGRILSFHSQDVISAACAGARIKDILGGGSYRGQGDRLDDRADLERTMDLAVLEKLPGRAPQRSFVSNYQPKVITVGIGGNDAGLIDKLKACAMPDRCEWSDPLRQAQVAAEIGRLYQPLVATYARLLADAPDARLFVVGYPDIMADTERCGGLTGTLFDVAERAFVIRGVRLLNAVVSKAARAAGVNYIDVHEAFKGKRLCDASPLAMNGLRLGDDVAPFSPLPTLRLIGSETFHPTPFGHAQLAPIVGTAIANGASDSCVEECDTPFMNEEAPSPKLAYEGLLAETPVTIRDPVLHLQVPAGIVKPFTPVRVEVHSQVVTLGTADANTDGSVNAEFTLPSELAPGYHTVHVYAQDRFERPIELYQAFGFYDDEGKEAEMAAAIEIPSSNPPSQEHHPTLQDVKGAEQTGYELPSIPEKTKLLPYWIAAVGLGVTGVIIAVLVGRRLISTHRPDG